MKRIHKLLAGGLAVCIWLTGIMLPNRIWAQEAAVDAGLVGQAAEASLILSESGQESAALGITARSANRILVRLEEAGCITTVGKASAGKGRPARIMKITLPDSLEQN